MAQPLRDPHRQESADNQESARKLSEEHVTPYHADIVAIE